MNLCSIWLSDEELEVLKGLAAQKDLTAGQVLRQALRMYQWVDFRLSRGDRMWPDDPVVGCGSDE